jgi:hypothetical protein
MSVWVSNPACHATSLSLCLSGPCSPVLPLSLTPPPPTPLHTNEPDVLQTTRSSTVDAQEQAGACGGGAGLSANTVRYCHPGGVTTVAPSEGRKFPEVKYNHVMCTSIARGRIPTEIPKFGVRPPRVHVSAKGGGGGGMTDE